jgi:hypothetical protein
MVFPIISGMAQPAAALPSEERVRELTADPKLTADDANRYADQFLGDGKPAIALMFLERSKDETRLRDVVKSAADAGDAFLLHGVNRIRPATVEARQWRDAAARARAAGKLLFARDCYEQSGDADKAAEAHAEWLKIFETKSPEPKAQSPEAPPAPPGGNGTT